LVGAATPRRTDMAYSDEYRELMENARDAIEALRDETDEWQWGMRFTLRLAYQRLCSDLDEEERREEADLDAECDETDQNPWLPGAKVCGGGPVGGAPSPRAQG
jgi:hypothetical protein